MHLHSHAFNNITSTSTTPNSETFSVWFSHSFNTAHQICVCAWRASTEQQHRKLVFGILSLPLILLLFYVWFEFNQPIWNRKNEFLHTLLCIVLFVKWQAGYYAYIMLSTFIEIHPNSSWYGGGKWKIKISTKHTCTEKPTKKMYRDWSVYIL